MEAVFILDVVDVDDDVNDDDDVAPLAAADVFVDEFLEESLSLTEEEGFCLDEEAEDGLVLVAVAAAAAEAPEEAGDRGDDDEDAAADDAPDVAILLE